MSLLSLFGLLISKHGCSQRKLLMWGFYVSLSKKPTASGRAQSLQTKSTALGRAWSLHTRATAEGIAWIQQGEEKASIPLQQAYVLEAEWKVPRIFCRLQLGEADKLLTGLLYEFEYYKEEFDKSMRRRSSMTRTRENKNFCLNTVLCRTMYICEDASSVLKPNQSVSLRVCQHPSRSLWLHQRPGQSLQLHLHTNLSPIQSQC